MADLKKTIDIIFQGVDNTTGVIESIGGGLTKVGAGVKQASQPFADMSDTILKTSAAIIGLGGVFLAFAVGEAITLENSMVELNKVMGDGEGAAADYADAFSEISNKFGVGKADIISLAADFKQSGFTIAESLLLVENALTTAATSELTYDQAGDALIRTLNGFQAPASEAAKIMDIVANATNKFALNATELSSGLSILSPIAAQIGLSFEETVGILTPVIEVFGSGSEAANGLRTALLNLAGDSKPVLDALQSIGIDTTEVVTAKERLQALTDVFPSLTDAKQLNIAADIAGTQQAAKLILVLKNQAKVILATEEAYNSQGAAAAELAIALAKTEIQLDRFKNSFINLSAAIGGEITNEFGEVAEAATKLNVALETALSSDSVQPLFDALRGFLSSFAAELEGIAKALPDALKGVDFSPLIDSLGEIGDSISELFGGLDLTKPEDLEKAIQFIVDTLGSLFTVTQSIIASFKEFISTGIDLVDQFNSEDDAIKETVGNIIGFGKQINILGGFLESFGGIIQGVAVVFGTLFSLNTLSKIPQTISAIGTAVGLLKKGFVAFEIAIGLGSGSMAAFVVAAAPLILAVGGIAAIFAELNNGAISSFVDDLFDLSRKEEFAAETTEIFGKAQADLLRQFQDGSLTRQEFVRATRDIADAQILASFAASDMTDAMFENAKSLLTSEEALTKLNDLYATSATEAGLLAEETIKAGESGKTAFEGGIVELEKYVDEFKKASEAAKGLGGEVELDDLGNEIAKVTDQTKDLKNTISDLNNTTATIEVISNTQQAQNDLEKFQTIVESLNSTIESTGTTLVGLGDVIGGADFGNLGHFDQQALIKAFEQEAKLRNTSIELQNRLILTEVKLAEARLKSIQSGDAAIVIETSGLEPILDLLLTTIIQNAQVRASVDGAAFLVGAL